MHSPQGHRLKEHISFKAEKQKMEVRAMAYLVRKAQIAQGMKYAIVFIASVPLLVAYPFLQKYFTKGIMIGSVKG